MQKVALVYIGNIEICPYRQLYEKILKKKGIDFDVLFWERDKLSTAYPDNYIFFSFKSDVNKKKSRKTGDFLNYYWWLRKKIKEKKYSHFIFLDTISGILGYLSGFYKESIGMQEIRDYTHDFNIIFRFVEKRAFGKMKKICVSSPAFNDFLPCGKTAIIAHNFNEQEYLNHRGKSTFKKKRKGQVLEVGYLGNVKYYEQQVKIIDEFADDERFNVTFHGIGPDYARLKQYIDDRKICNIHMTGYYQGTDKEILYKNVDVILNCYDIGLGNEIKYAVSNKYYDGLIYHIPQIVERYGYKGEIVQQNGIGLAWNYGDAKLNNLLWEYYHSIDETHFDRQCGFLMEKYYAEYCNYKETIEDFIIEGK